MKTVGGLRFYPITETLFMSAALEEYLGGLFPLHIGLHRAESGWIPSLAVGSMLLWIDDESYADETVAVQKALLERKRSVLVRLSEPASEQLQALAEKTGKKREELVIGALERVLKSV